MTVLLGNRSDFEEYLHILADEIVQMAARVLGRQCRIGVSHMTPELSRLHGAYREAMEALRQADPAEGGVRFISDLVPAVRGGQALCARALQAIDQHYREADLSLVSLSAMLDVSPNHPERLHQEIRRGDLHQHPDPQAHGGRPPYAGDDRFAHPGGGGPLRLHRPTLFQLLL